MRNVKVSDFDTIRTDVILNNIRDYAGYISEHNDILQLIPDRRDLKKIAQCLEQVTLYIKENAWRKEEE